MNQIIKVEPKEDRKKVIAGKLAALAEKKSKGKLTLEDLDAKLDIIIEMLTEQRD